MMANAADKDVGNLNGSQGCQDDMLETPRGHPHELAALQPNHLSNLRGHASRHFHGSLPTRKSGVRHLAEGHRVVPQLALLIEREDALVITKGPLLQDRRHGEAGV